MTILTFLKAQFCQIGLIRQIYTKAQSFRELPFLPPDTETGKTQLVISQCMFEREHSSYLCHDQFFPLTDLTQFFLTSSHDHRNDTIKSGFNTWS